MGFNLPRSGLVQHQDPADGGLQCWVVPLGICLPLILSVMTALIASESFTFPAARFNAYKLRRLDRWLLQCKPRTAQPVQFEVGMGRPPPQACRWSPSVYKPFSTLSRRSQLQMAFRHCAKSSPALRDWHSASPADRSGRRREVFWFIRPNEQAAASACHAVSKSAMASSWPTPPQSCRISAVRSEPSYP